MSPPIEENPEELKQLVKMVAGGGGLRLLLPWAFGRVQATKKLIELLKVIFVVGGAVQFWIEPWVRAASSGKFCPQLPWWGTLALGLSFAVIEMALSNYLMHQENERHEVLAEKVNGTLPPGRPAL